MIPSEDSLTAGGLRTFSVAPPRTECRGVKLPWENRTRLSLTLLTLFAFGVQKESWDGPGTRRRWFQISAAVPALCSWFTAAWSLPAVLGKASILLHRPDVAAQHLPLFYSSFFRISRWSVNLTCVFNGHYCISGRSSPAPCFNGNDSLYADMAAWKKLSSESA